MSFRPSLLLALAGMMVATAAQAIGFGPAPAGITMGSPLDIALSLRLEADDQIEPECVRAEAQFGDRRLPSYALRWAVDPGTQPGERRLRVQSLAPVDEPVVMLQVSVGCATRVMRHYTMLADPPLAPAAPMAAPDVLPVPAAGPIGEAAAAAQRPRLAPTIAATSLPGPRATAAGSAARPTPRVRRNGTATRTARPRSVATAAQAPRAARPRLALEAPDPALIERAVAAAVAEQQASASAQAASAVAQAASAAAAAASAAERVKALEDQVERLLADGRQQREQMQQLRTRAAANESAGRALPWLGAAVAALALLVGWLALRLRQARRDAQDKWWADAAEVLADVRPDPQAADARGLVHPRQPVPGRGAEPAPAADLSLDLSLPDEVAASEAVTAPTLQAPVTVEPAWTTSPQPRPVSAEELFDLEQQAEFFVVLGQDEAAIDLLMGHLRDSGGTSPLPYLKLLEIYRRRGDRDAYERTRSRFNQRFNAYAPDWGTDMQQGRTLADYPQVMARLQAAWGQPIDAMAELETLLFRKDGGELFELPAYREVLLLYSLAHDLLHREGTAQADVDVLLPLGSAAPDAPPALRTDLPLTLGEATLVLRPDVTQYHQIDLDISAPATAPDAGIDLHLDDADLAPALRRHGS